MYARSELIQRLDRERKKRRRIRAVGSFLVFLFFGALLFYCAHITVDAIEHHQKYGQYSTRR